MTDRSLAKHKATNKRDADELRRDLESFGHAYLSLKRNFAMITSISLSMLIGVYALFKIAGTFLATIHDYCALAWKIAMPTLSSGYSVFRCDYQDPYIAWILLLGIIMLGIPVCSIVAYYRGRAVTAIE